MPALVIKDLPVEIHRRLKDDAIHQHRSMTQQAIVILEQGLRRVRPIPAFKAYRGSFPLTKQFGVRCVTEDVPVQKACPDIAVSLADFINRSSGGPVVRETRGEYHARRKRKGGDPRSRPGEPA